MKPALSEKGRIVLSIDPTLPEEGYRIQCRKNGIHITGGSGKGVFYGTQTLYKALPVHSQGRPALPAATVQDTPAFSYRGFMVDVGRHYFDIGYLEELLDIMALHGINVFHWHLTEDQGWRIPVPAYPRLTEVGAYRTRSILEPGSTQFDTIPVQGHYTREEMEHLVRYAADRQITVIPEIDMPGHMLAALASYPELGCTGGPYAVAERFGVFADVLCPGKDATLDFAKAVLEEVMDIFPSQYIHLGGDECPKERWESCPDCQARIRELGLRTCRGKARRTGFRLGSWNRCRRCSGPAAGT
jgi:hexosaminidase